MILAKGMGSPECASVTFPLTTVWAIAAKDNMKRKKSVIKGFRRNKG
jgi:hypothetical protein